MCSTTTSQSGSSEPSNSKGTIFTSARKVVLVFSSVCLSVLPSDYLKSGERICKKPEVCLGPSNNRLDFVDDPDYAHTDFHETFYQMCGQGTIIHYFPRLQSLTDCVV